MADLVITSSEVKKDEVNALVFNGTAGETLTPGQSCYQDKSDGNKIKRSDADFSSVTAEVKGIALCEADLDQPIQLIIGGIVTLGPAASLVQGKSYFASDTPGGIKPADDLVTGDFASFLGIANASDQLIMGILNSGIQIP